MPLDRNYRLAPDFALWEFLKGGKMINGAYVTYEHKFFSLNAVTQNGYLSHLKVIAHEMQKIRDHYKAPVIVHPGGGWRFEDSKFHGKALACDFTVQGQKHSAVQAYLNPWYPGGVGSYDKHTHLDCRHLFGYKAPARWKGKSQ